MKDDIIHIVLSSSNDFIEHCATTMASILYNISRKYFVKFYILSYDISEKNKKKIDKLKKIKTCTIEYPSFNENLLDIFKTVKLPPHVSKMTYARILIPDILPNINKAIFIDSDTIVRKDISELWNINIQNNYFAMVEDACWKLHSKRLWGNDSQYYFNCGLILINAQKLREIEYFNKIKKQIAKRSNSYRICDQDVLNDTFKNNILKIDMKWNFHHEKYTKQGYSKIDDYENYNECLGNPSIVHYTGADKPWLMLERHRYKKDYFFYKKLTPFYKAFDIQNYRLNSNKYFSISINEHIILKKIEFPKNTNRKKKILKNNKKFFSQFFKIQDQNGTYRLSAGPITIVKKINTDNKKCIKILGLPLFYKKKIVKSKSNDYLLKQLLVTQDKVEKLLALNIKMNKKIANLKCIIEAQKIHEKTFAPYKNAFSGKDVVLVCTGPTAKKYRMLPNAIHIGVNGAIYLNNVILDYLFVQDYTIHQKNNEKLVEDAFIYKGNNCKKFFGVIPDEHLSTIKTCIERIPIRFSFDKNCNQYILEDLEKNNIANDLSREPIGNFLGTPFSALQFILYTNPRRIYLVGWDCSSGYAYNKDNAINPANYQIEILKKYFIPFIEINYPNIELISINPVGLKGYFNDYFTGDNKL